MTQPVTGPIDVDVIVAWAKIGDDTAKRDELDLIIAATNAVVRDLPVAQLAGVDPEPWSDRVIAGATMLCKRLWRRRNTPDGVQQVNDDGSVTYVARNDPDIALLLELGAYRKPAAK